MNQCVVVALGVLVYLSSQGLSNSDSMLNNLENELESDLASELSKLDKYIKKCDCFILLDVKKASPEWYCSTKSDKDCE